MTGKFFFFWGGGLILVQGFVWVLFETVGLWFLPPFDHPCRSFLSLELGAGSICPGEGGGGGVSVEIPVGWWKRDSPAFRSLEVGISDSALANHPTQFLPLLESIGFPPFKAGRLGFTLLQLQRDITLTISQLIPQFTPFLSRPSCSRHFIGLPALPSFARFCSARISSYTCEIFSDLEKASFDMANYKSPQFDLGILRRQN